MRVERALVGILCVVAVAANGCGGRLAYNLPPASRLMEPGPGVGGPGPGVIPPAGSPYGMYGGAVGRFGSTGPGGMGGPMGGGAYCATPGPQQMPMQARGMMPTRGPMQARGPMPARVPMQARGPMPNSGIMQASYNCGCEEGQPCSCGEDCQCGAEGGCGEACGYGAAGGCGEACGCGESCPIEGCPEGCPCEEGAQPIDGEVMAGGPIDSQIMQAGFGHHGHGLFGHGGYIRPGSVESYADGGAGSGMATSQVAFLGDEGVQISWDVSGYGMFDSTPLVIPGRQDFYQGAIYRLRLTNVPGRPGVELFPTLEIAPVTPRTDSFLAHAPIPVQFTTEDFDQVLSGNFVTKVIYLPDPEFQELALAGVETLVSTRLGPGVDPIAEADRRGSILAILRMGNKDLRGGNVIQEYESEVVPASYKTTGNGRDSYESQALYNEEVNAAGKPTNSGVTQVQYCGPYGDGCYDGGYGGGYGDGSMGGMPVGMPTSSAPTPVPPNMVAGGPQWGMPITGTPIGLPGPPHVPLGVPAGLQKHVMKNRTKVLLPPPNSQVTLSVKQRPGLNYPRPVTKVHVDETQQEPLRLMPGWLSGMFSGHGANHANGSAYCQ